MFYNYLFIEHIDKKKDINSFRLLAVFNFENRKIALTIENIFNMN
jgi:hypothetical protein